MRKKKTSNDDIMINKMIEHKQIQKEKQEEKIPINVSSDDNYERNKNIKYN